MLEEELVIGRGITGWNDLDSSNLLFISSLDCLNLTFKFSSDASKREISLFVFPLATLDNSNKVPIASITPVPIELVI